MLALRSTGERPGQRVTSDVQYEYLDRWDVDRLNKYSKPIRIGSPGCPRPTVRPATLSGCTASPIRPLFQSAATSRPPQPGSLPFLTGTGRPSR
ncbi:hypothetical protein BQ8482_570012 [Mesorhizobium delmotii]|uniref:Uncharacterized protein n=1 Tax=Mesorhizobium delmotii TaxID=1631247 RepID=A0A2P9AV21_9HYPH|nr:hypothetical protein BQ8482_570012 [Mesorhizobium delmotii]